MEQSDVIALLDILGLAGYQYSGGNVMIPCPFASVSGHRRTVDTHPSLGILPNEFGAAWNCLGCERHGSIWQFVRRLKKEAHFDTGEAEKFLKALLVVDPENVAKNLPKYEDHFVQGKFDSRVAFPESWLKPYSGSVPRALLERGITIETAKEFDIGHDRLTRRIFYPVRAHDRKLIGAVGGLIPKNDRLPKYINYWAHLHDNCGYPVISGMCSVCGENQIPQKKITPGFRKSSFLYGEHLAATVHGPTIVVVEGIVDMLCVLQAVRRRKDLRSRFLPLATFGSKVSDTQVDKIAQYGNGSVYAFFDNDAAGHVGEADFRERIKRRVRYYRVSYPPHDEGSDPGSLSVKEIQTMLTEAKVVLS